MAFKDTNWHPTAIRRLLVDIVLTDPYDVRDANYLPADGTWDTKTLRFCDGGDAGQGGLVVYGGNDYYPALLDFDPGSAVVDFGGSTQDADAQITLSNHRYVWQKRHSANPQETTELDVHLSQLLRDYGPGLVTVTEVAYLPNTTTLDAQQVFVGVVVSCPSDDDTCTVYAVEDRRFDRDIPNMASPTGGIGPGIITKVDYPRAPKAEFGKTLPILYSKKTITPSGAAEGGAGLFVNPRYMVGLSPCRLVEAVYDGSGATRVTRAVANKFPSGVASLGMDYFLWVPDLNTLATMSVDEHDTTTESYADVPNQVVASLWINPNTFKASSGVTNPGYAFDGRHDTFASIANSGATAYLEAYFPYVPPQGRIKDVYMSILYATSSTGAGATDPTVNARFGIWNAAVGDWHIKDVGDTTNPLAMTRLNLNAGSLTIRTSSAWLKGTSKWDDPAQPWNRWAWEGNDAAGNRQDCYGRIEVTQNGANLDVVGWGLLIDYYPFATSFPTAGGQTGRVLK